MWSTSELEEGTQFDAGADLVREPVPVAYNPSVPVEYFDADEFREEDDPPAPDRPGSEL